MELLFFVFIVVLAVVILSTGLKIVPQGQEWVVERLGKFHVVLEPGLNLVLPFLDVVRYKVSTKDLILDIPQQEVITKDNAVILANAIAFIKVTNIERAVYGVENFAHAMQNMIQTSLRSIVGGLELNEALSSREKIKAQLKQAISDEAEDWGLTVKSVEIQDIRPSENMQKSMEMQASAEREKIALITKSEGKKQSTILEAEAKMESAKKEAEAVVIAAKGNAESAVIAAKASAEAIDEISKALKNNPDTAAYLLGEKYITALENLNHSPNAKTVIMPADIPNAIKSILGK